MKHLLATVVLLTMVITIGETAEAKENKKVQAKGQTDLMIVKLEKTTIHKQAVAHESCMMLINQLGNGQRIMLTMRNPYAKGEVTQAHCILPDGSHISWPADSRPEDSGPEDL